MTPQELGGAAVRTNADHEELWEFRLYPALWGEGNAEPQATPAQQAEILLALDAHLPPVRARRSATF